VKPTATAASIALPPRFITSTPTCEAIWLTDATIPLLPRTGGRDAASVAKRAGDSAVNKRAKHKMRESVFLEFIKLILLFSKRIDPGQRSSNTNHKKPQDK